MATKVFEKRIDLSENKRVYFISDLHLGAPDHAASREREDRVIRWIDSIKTDAQEIFFVGDVFDFWIEYKHCIPKGYIRFLGKLASLVDQGIKVSFFTGNHDMWMGDYFPSEMSIPVYKAPIRIICNEKSFMVGHGDGLGPGDYFYKLLKILFTSPICLWLFKRVHPSIGMGVAQFWSKSSRKGKKEEDEVYKGEEEWLWQYTKEQEKIKHHDYYIFGHRHLPLDLPVGDKESRYINLGEWIDQCHYACFDGQNLKLIPYAD